ncbi:hypothetical protein L218DRAFT_945430 [Marasmius fiardii PR-910]|nr:hypothetical protein L218DRAFT_945430 [Marasmius fiardii PR-910]
MELKQPCCIVRDILKGRLVESRFRKRKLRINYLRVLRAKCRGSLKSGSAWLLNIEGRAEGVKFRIDMKAEGNYLHHPSNIRCARYGNVGIPNVEIITSAFDLLRKSGILSVNFVISHVAKNQVIESFIRLRDRTKTTPMRKPARFGLDYVDEYDIAGVDRDPGKRTTRLSFHCAVRLHQVHSFSSDVHEAISLKATMDQGKKT